MPTTRQQTNTQEEESEGIDVSLVETEYGEQTVAEMNFSALMMNIEQILNKLTRITDDVGKIFNFISSQTSTTANPATTNDVQPNDNQTATQQLCDNIRELIQETNQPTWEREARRIKRMIENIWYKQLNDRRKQFWLKLRNENLSKLYETWRNQTPMVLPQQLQMLKINGEPDDQRRRREKQVLDNYKTERDLLELRAQSHEEKYKRLDEEMISIISEKATGRCKDILVTLWYEDTKREEAISEKRWKSKNEVWLKKYEADFCIKYADKNPFIKESEEIGIYRQTYPPRRQRPTRYPQGRTRSQSPVNRNEPRNNLNRLPRNNETAIQGRPLYSEIVQRRGQEPGSYYQRGGSDFTENRTTYIGQQFRRNRRSPSRRPFYRGRLTDNSYARNRRDSRYSNDRRYANQDARGNFEYAEENRREEALPSETTNQYQGPFLEQDDQIMQEL